MDGDRVMGTMWELFETGLAFLAVGFVLSMLDISLGLHLARIGVLLIGGSILLSVLAVAVVVVLATSSSASQGAPQRHRRSPDTHVQPPRRPPAARRSEREATRTPVASPTAGNERLDLDVETIDDYRR